MANVTAYAFNCKNPTLAARIASLPANRITRILDSMGYRNVNIMQQFNSPQKCEAAMFIVERAVDGSLADLQQWEEEAKQCTGRPVMKYTHAKPAKYSVHYVMHGVTKVTRTFPDKRSAMAYVRKLCRVHGINAEQFAREYMDGFNAISQRGECMSAGIKSRNGWTLDICRM
jgi:hypothetical protein